MSQMINFSSREGKDQPYLPGDIIREISSHIEIKEIISVFALVCKQFYKICEPRISLAKREIEILRQLYPPKLIQAMGGIYKFYILPKGDFENYQGIDYDEFLKCVTRNMKNSIMRGQDLFLSQSKKAFLAFRFNCHKDNHDNLCTDSEPLITVWISKNTLPNPTFMDIDKVSNLYPYLARLVRQEPCGVLSPKKRMCFKTWIEKSPKTIHHRSVVKLA